MSDIAKWGLLVAGAIALLALVFALPIFQTDVSFLPDALQGFISYCGDALVFGRGLINNFFLPAARPMVTVVLWWIIVRTFLLTGVKIGTWVYHFIFK